MNDIVTVNVDCTGDPNYIGPNIKIHEKFLKQLARENGVECLGCAFVSATISAHFRGKYDKLFKFMKEYWGMDKEEFDVTIEES